jgi:hypothetical protein
MEASAGCEPAANASTQAEMSSEGIRRAASVAESILPDSSNPATEFYRRWRSGLLKGATTRART